MNYVSPRGRSWDEVEKELFTPEEIAASDRRVARMIARTEAKIAKEELPKKSKVLHNLKRPIVAVPT
jgi:hypothetical protein